MFQPTHAGLKTAESSCGARRGADRGYPETEPRPPPLGRGTPRAGVRMLHTQSFPSEIWRVLTITDVGTVTHGGLDHQHCTHALCTLHARIVHAARTHLLCTLHARRLHARIVHAAHTHCARCTHALCTLHARIVHAAQFEHFARCFQDPPLLQCAVGVSPTKAVLLDSVVVLCTQCSSYQDPVVGNRQCFAVSGCLINTFTGGCVIGAGRHPDENVVELHLVAPVHRPPHLWPQYVPF